MFTGIIEEIGTVEQIRRGRSSAVLAIRAKKVLSGAKTGDSIAVNGVCLTVTGLFPDSFTADIMHETLNRSALSKLTPKSRVNLERTMPADGRFGGHIVAGHVDGVGKIVRLQRDGTAFRCTIQAPPEILRYIVEKRADLHAHVGKIYQQIKNPANGTAEHRQSRDCLYRIH